MPLTEADFEAVHAAIASDIDRFLQIVGDITHDWQSRFYMQLAGGTLFSQLRGLVPDANKAYFDNHSNQMITSSGNPTKYIHTFGEARPWNQTKRLLGTFNSDDLSNLKSTLVQQLNIRRLSFDMGPISPWNNGLGGMDDRISRVLYICHVFDAAPNTKVEHLNGAGNLPNEDPLSIELIPNYIFTFSYDPVAIQKHRVTVRRKDDGEVMIDICSRSSNNTSTGGVYSLGALTKFLELPLLRGVKEPNSKIYAISTNAAGMTVYSPTAAGYNLFQKFLVVCVKEITDWGLAYNNCKLNFPTVGIAAQRCVLGTGDLFFGEMLGQIAGFGIEFGAKTTKLYSYADCLLATGGFNRYVNIYNNIKSINIAELTTTKDEIIGYLDAIIEELNSGCVFGFLMYRDCLYFKNKIIEWFGRLAEGYAIINALFNASVAAGNTPEQADTAITESAESRLTLDKFTELTFTTASEYLTNMKNEADDQLGYYKVFYNIMTDFSELSVDGGAAGVTEMVGVVDKFVSGKFKGLDVVPAIDPRTLRAVLYSYIKNSYLALTPTREGIFTLLAGDAVMQNLFSQVCLVHYALDKQGRPTVASLSSFFATPGAPGVIETTIVSSSETRSRPDFLKARYYDPPVGAFGLPTFIADPDRRPDSLFPGTLVDPILSGPHSLGAVIVSVSVIPFSVSVITRKRVLNEYGFLPGESTSGAKISVTHRIRKGPKAEPERPQKKAAPVKTQAVIAAKKQQLTARRRHASADEDDDALGAGAGVPHGASLESLIRENSRRIREGNAKKAKAARKVLRGGGVLNTSPPETYRVRLADFDDYYEYREISEVAAERINRMLESYRSGQFKEPSPRQNEDLNQFIRDNFSSIETLADLISATLNLLVLLRDEACESGFEYEYMSEVLNLSTLCAEYYNDPDSSLDDMINQFVNTLFSAPYTAILFNSSVNSTDIQIIVRLLDSTLQKAYAEEEEETGAEDDNTGTTTEPEPETTASPIPNVNSLRRRRNTLRSQRIRTGVPLTPEETAELVEINARLPATPSHVTARPAEPCYEYESELPARKRSTGVRRRDPATGKLCIVPEDRSPDTSNLVEVTPSSSSGSRTVGGARRATRNRSRRHLRRTRRRAAERSRRKMTRRRR